MTTNPGTTPIKLRIVSGTEPLLTYSQTKEKLFLIHFGGSVGKKEARIVKNHPFCMSFVKSTHSHGIINERDSF